MRTEAPRPLLLRKGTRASQLEIQRTKLTLDKVYSYIKNQFTGYVRTVKADIPRLVATLESEKIVKGVGGWQGEYLAAMDRLVPEVYKAELLAMSNRLAKASVGIGFKPPPAEILQEMLDNLLDNIEQTTQEERDQILEILANAVSQGQSPVRTARELADVIGLTDSQQGWVDSYRTLLENNSSQALTRALRDRRYDSTVQNAIDENDFLSQDQIDAMVERYRERLLDMRGETIARTEALKITEQVRADSMADVADQAGIDTDLIAKQWSATHDQRTRDTHAALDGQARLMSDPFDSESGAELDHPGDGSAPPEEVINCRCTTVYHVFSKQEELDAFLAENGQGKYDDQES